MTPEQIAALEAERDNALAEAKMWQSEAKEFATNNDALAVLVADVRKSLTERHLIGCDGCGGGQFCWLRRVLHTLQFAEDDQRVLERARLVTEVVKNLDEYLGLHFNAPRSGAWTKLKESRARLAAHDAGTKETK